MIFRAEAFFLIPNNIITTAAEDELRRLSQASPLSQA
jgi:hypothetical protein